MVTFKRKKDEEIVITKIKPVKSDLKKIVKQIKRIYK